jgi:ribonuclease D
MEWPWNDWKRNDLQNKIGLIQIASEDKIALFHIGLHPGKTTEDIIAPSLRKLLESPTIGKVGVSVLMADFSRLIRFFGLKPKGAIELSHLYRLVKFGPRKPEFVSVKLVSLAHQVEEQLGLPLYKGDVRTSNWSKPLSNDQINYAAGDAYAGFMLYKCMNAKRLAMSPTPPLPIYAERYPKGKTSKDDPILLDVGDGTIMTTEAFFGVKPAKSGTTGTTSKAPKKAQTAGTSTQPLDHASQTLYEELAVRRAILAENAKLPAQRIISDSLLEAIARERPCDAKSLLEVKGIGKIQQQKYGDAWLEVISLFLATNGIEQPASIAKPTSSTVDRAAQNQPTTQPLQTPGRSQSRRHVARLNSPDSSPAFDTPPPQTPQLHTGLSFTMAETNLDADGNGSDGTTPSYDTDDTLPSLDFGSPSRRLSSGTKRKRAESPTKHDQESRQPMQDAQSKLAEPSPTKPKQPTTHTTQHASLKALEGAPSIPQTTESATVPLNPCFRIAKSKLLAFSKLVTRKLPPRPVDAPPIVTEHTLGLIVNTSPTTQDELERIPGIDSFLYACEKTGMDLLRNVVKFAPART